MSETMGATPIELVRKWHALAERRRNYFVELYRSERWRRYFTEEAFRRQMKDVIQNVEIWDKVLADMSRRSNLAKAA